MLLGIGAVRMSIHVRVCACVRARVCMYVQVYGSHERYASKPIPWNLEAIYQPVSVERFLMSLQLVP